MRGRTRNLVENFVTFIFFILILFGIYLLIINYTDIGKNLDLVSPQKVIEKFVDKNEEKKDIEVKEPQNDTFKIEVKKAESNTTTEVKKDKEITQEQKVEPVIEVKEDTQADLPVQLEEKKIEKKVVIEKKVEPAKKDEEKKEEEKKEEKTNDAVSFDAIVKEKFSLINNFLRDTKKQINEELKILVIPKSNNQRYANIRITVLKNGEYEQLTLMDGDKEYFELITPAILSVFPVTINEKISDQFPRYFRMKIEE